jgi:DNA-binding MarR family transcriptional regulator
MILMRKNGGVSQKDIASQLSLAPSTVTRFVEKLKNQGYLTKQRDGRNMTIELTDDGRRVSADMEREYESVVQDIRDLMGEKYLETVGKLLDFGSKEIAKNI